ncbi:restriction endonuclease subunit S [Trichloromonas sp.]|uniref:restriction endonuclease subunit S n=1 Tax=Trichloromonas sp. TaxID=3069249 RepID=UPI003D8198F3
MTWPRVKLKTLLTQPVQNGYSPICPDAPNGKWILALGALNGSGFDATQVKPAPIGDNRVDNFLLQTGDFLVSRSNTLNKVGRAAVFKGQIDNCAYPDLMMRFRVDESSINPEFLDMYLRSSEAVRHFQRAASGTSETMVKINKRAVENLLVPQPPFAEQAAIADLLSTWDVAIEKTERLIAAKERQKKCLMQQLLTGHQRLNGFKKPWSEFPLGELFQERSERASDHLPLLSITSGEGIIHRNEDRKDTSNEDKSNYLRICPGDIGYNTMRMWQGVSALSSLEGIVSPAYTICTPKKESDGEFMAYLFKLPRVINLFYRYSQGLTSDTWNLKYKHFRKIKVVVPEIEEQKAIANILKVCDEQIDLLKKQVEGYRRQKRGLMQKLLTGQWRVKARREQPA